RSPAPRASQRQTPSQARRAATPATTSSGSSLPSLEYVAVANRTAGDGKIGRQDLAVLPGVAAADHHRFSALARVDDRGAATRAIEAYRDSTRSAPHLVGDGHGVAGELDAAGDRDANRTPAGTGVDVF